MRRSTPCGGYEELFCAAIRRPALRFPRTPRGAWVCRSSTTWPTLHGLDYEAIGLGDLGKPQGYLERQVNGWIKRYGGSQTDDIPRVEEISEWLVEHLPPEDGASLIHNDYKFDNVIVGADDITQIIGVLDWEMATIGDPLSDLGTAISYWIDPHDPDDAGHPLGAYESAGQSDADGARRRAMPRPLGGMSRTSTTTSRLPSSRRRS